MVVDRPGDRLTTLAAQPRPRDSWLRVAIFHESRDTATRVLIKVRVRVPVRGGAGACNVRVRVRVKEIIIHR